MKTVTLGEIADWGSGGTPKRSIPEYFGDGTPWLSIADLNDGVVTGAKESLTPAGVANSSAKIVPPGTIFIAMYGSIGKLGIAATEMATSQAIAFAKPKDGLVDRRFLFHFLLAQRPKLQALGRGGTQMNIGQGDLKAWPMPLPSLPEQRRIAAILDHADALRAKRRQVLTHLNNLPQALLGELLQAGFVRVALGDLIAAGPKNGLYRPSSDYGSGTPIVRIDSFKFGSGIIAMDSLRRLRASDSEVAEFALAPGDLVVNRVNSREHVGKTALVGELHEPTVFESNMMRIRVDQERLRSSFAVEFMQTKDVRAQVAPMTKDAVNQSSINQADVRSLRIPLPPIELQRQFEARVDAINARRAAVQRALAADDELFASLQSRAFRGEL